MHAMHLEFKTCSACKHRGGIAATQNFYPIVAMLQRRKEKQIEFLAAVNES
jgi:hypothetical protein